MDPFHIAEKQRKTIKKTNTQNLQEKDEITSGSQNSTRNSEEFQHVFHVHPIPNGPLDPFFFDPRNHWLKVPDSSKACRICGTTEALPKLAPDFFF
jgi:hypothetical protein